MPQNDEELKEYQDYKDYQDYVAYQKSQGPQKQPNVYFPYDEKNQGMQLAANTEDFVRNKAIPWVKEHPGQVAAIATSMALPGLGAAETAAQRVLIPAGAAGLTRYTQGVLNKEPFLNNIYNSGKEAAHSAYINTGGEALMGAAQMLPGLLKSTGSLAYSKAKPVLTEAAKRLGIETSEIPAGMLSSNPLVKKLESGLVNSKEFLTDLLGNKAKEQYRNLAQKIESGSGEAAQELASAIPKYVKSGSEEGVVKLGLLSGLQDKGFDLGYRALTSKPVQGAAAFSSEKAGPWIEQQLQKGLVQKGVRTIGSGGTGFLLGRSSNNQ